MTVRTSRPPGTADGDRHMGDAPVRVLLYHRVATLRRDPQLLAVTPEHFAEHLEVLNRCAHPMSLADLAGDLGRKTVRPRSVVVTFDDGYADNLTAAALLKAANVPATVFVATGYLDQRREFWWDELERILLSDVALPARIELTLVGESVEVDLRGTDPIDTNACHAHDTWNVTHCNDPTPRHALYRRLFEPLRRAPHDERWEALDLLRRRADQPMTVRPAHRMMSEGEVRELASDGLIDVGAHTITHPVLSLRSTADQHREIVDSKKALERILDREVTTFSYPYGTRRDYTGETVELTRTAGFTCACSNFNEPIGRQTDLFQLPRVLVRDWDGETFLRHIEEAWSGVC